MLNEILGVNCCTLTAALAERLLVAPVAVTLYEADLRLEGMVMPVGGSTPLASALAVAAVPLSAIVTISCAAKPLPQTVTRPPPFAVAGVIVRAAFGVGVAVAVGVGMAVAVAVGANMVVAVGVGASVATAAVGGSVAALVMGASVALRAVRLTISTSAANAAPMR
jgi:hypothetical protein